MSSHSALLGQPPASDDDTTIVRAWFVFIGKAGKDPSNGFSLLPRPLQNQYHYESRGPAIIAYNVVFTLIMLVVTGWRICLRIQNYKLRFGWDDWGIILATLIAVISPILSIISVPLGGDGKHIYDVTYREFAFYIVLNGPRTLFFYLPLNLVKISIILFYMRLNGFTSHRWMIVHWTLFALCVSHLLTSLFVTIFGSYPAPSFWNFRLMASEPERPKTVNQLAVLIALNVAHIFTDAALLIVPVAMLWSVQMKRSTKFRVWMIGLVGCLNIFVNIMRTVENNKGSKAKDVTWEHININVWSMLEITIGVTTASLPILSVVFTKFWKNHVAGWIGWAGVRPAGRHPNKPDIKNYIHRRWPGGRARHDYVNEDDSLGLSGTTTVSDAHAVDVETKRFREELRSERGKEVDLKERSRNATGPGILGGGDLESGAHGEDGVNVGAAR